jgi:hypothetical protein
MITGWLFRISMMSSGQTMAQTPVLSQRSRRSHRHRRPLANGSSQT